MNFITFVWDKVDDFADRLDNRWFLVIWGWMCFFGGLVDFLAKSPVWGVFWTTVCVVLFIVASTIEELWPEDF